MQTSTDTPKKTARGAKAPPVVETKKRRTPSLAVKAKAAADKLAGTPTMRKGAKAKLPSSVEAGARPGEKMQPVKAPTKAAQVVALLNRKQGATNQEIMDATGWQTHSVRGFLAHLKKAGTKIEKTVDGKTSTYKIVTDEAV